MSIAWVELLKRSVFLFPNLLILMEEDETSENILLISQIWAFFFLLSHLLESKTQTENEPASVVQSSRGSRRQKTLKDGHTDSFWTLVLFMKMSKKWFSPCRKLNHVGKVYVILSAFMKRLVLNSQWCCGPSEHWIFRVLLEALFSLRNFWYLPFLITLCVEWERFYFEFPCFRILWSTLFCSSTAASRKTWRSGRTFRTYLLWKNTIPLTISKTEGES